MKKQDQFFPESYLEDLDSKDFEERRRAIWGLDAVGERTHIPRLKEIASNKKEEKALRVVAQKAIDNIQQRGKRKTEV